MQRDNYNRAALLYFVDYSIVVSLGLKLYLKFEVEFYVGEILR